MLWKNLCAAFLCAHFVEVIGRDESTLELLLQPYYYKDVLSGTVVAWMLFEYISRLVRWLDLKYDWLRHTVKRLILQVCFGIFVCALLAYLLVNLQFRFVLGQRMEDTTWFDYEFPFVVLLIVLVNVLYVTQFFISQATQRPAAVTIDCPPDDLVVGLVNEPRPRQVLHVKKGNKTIPMMTNEVAYIFKKGEASYLRSFEDQTYLIDETLDELEQQLEGLQFFRANRQTIISLLSCQSFSPESFGKLKVILNPPSMEHIIISQKRAPLFKKWISR